MRAKRIETKCAQKGHPVPESAWRRRSFWLTMMVLCRMLAYADTPVTVLWVDCGGEDERPCSKDELNKGYYLLPANTPSDNSSNFSDRLRCDSGLQIHVNTDHTVRCTNSTRLKVGETDPLFNYPWLSFARQNQFGSIQADQPITFAPILGTHNSYSNYADGGDSAFSVDQGFSITDQLQLGARTIRLDPWLFTNTDYQIRLCHSSEGYSISALTLCEMKDEQGKSLSRNRSFIFAIKEIAHWLKQHPSEFIVLRLHDFGQSWGSVGTLNGLVTDQTDSTYSVQVVGTSYSQYVIQYGLGDLVYKNPAFDPTSSQRLAAPDDYRFPSLRQFRAMGKQVMVVSAFPNQWAFEDANGEGNPGLGITGLGLAALSTPANYLSLAKCDARNLLARPHVPGTFANTGEDRSISQLLVNLSSSPSTAYLVDAPTVRQALACGYNWIELDFLDALNQAPNLSSLAGFFSLFPSTSNLPTALNYQCDNYGAATCDTTDHRREAMIWSWHPGQGVPNEPVRMTTGFGDSFGSWISADGASIAPYLCASQPTISGSSDATFPDDKLWYVTNTTGQWANGETTCQSEKGTDWHFWRPMSAVQNVRAWTALKNSGNAAAAWINHYQGPLQVLPKQISFTMQQGVVPATSQTVVLSGGFGGKITATPSNPSVVAASVPLYSQRDSKQTADDNSSNLYSISLGSAAARLTAGTYAFQVTIHEDFTLSNVNPGGATSTPLSSDSILNVTINVAPPVQVTVDSNPAGYNIFVDGGAYTTPHVFSWTPGSSHTVDASQPIINSFVLAAFHGWSDGKPVVHTVTAPAQGSQKLTADFDVSYFLTLSTTGHGKVNASGQGPGPFYRAGSTVDITAVADPNSYFQNFSGSLTGSMNPQKITMNGPKTVNAVFGDYALVHIPANSYGVPVTADGVRYQTPVDFQWIPGSSHTLSFPVWPLGTGKQAVFQKWLDGNLSNPRTISASNATYTPVLVLQWYVSTSVAPPGSGDITVSGWHDDGSQLRFTATAKSGYVFTGFSGDIQAATSPQTVTVTKPLNVVGNFTPDVLINVTEHVVHESPDNVQLALVLNNSGSGAATSVNVSMTALVTEGSGLVQPPASIPPIASIQGGTSATLPLSFTWPKSAHRIQLTVNITANGGAYQGTQILNFAR